MTRLAPVLLTLGLLAPALAADTPDPALRRLASLARVWGRVKYVHPAMATRAIDWDAALVRALPAVENATSNGEHRKAIAALLAELGDPATAVADVSAKEPAKTAAGSGDLRLEPIDATTALVIVSNDETLNAVPDLRPKVCALFDEAATRERVVLDLRGAGAPVELWPLTEALFRCLPRLLAEDVALPAARFLNHGFYEMQSVNGGAALGGLRQSQLAVSSSVVLRGEGGRTPRLAVIVDSGTVDLYEPLMGLQNAGVADVVQQGDVHDAGFWTETFEAGDGLSVTIRQGECLRGDGAAGFAADVVLPARTTSGPDLAREAALRAVRAGKTRRQPAAVVSVPFAPSAFVEEDYSETPYPSRELRLLALFRLWNAIEYFSPYKDGLEPTWDATLLDFIPRLREAKDATDYALAVSELATRLRDSHVTLASPVLDAYFGTHRPAVRVDLVEGETVVTEIAPELAASGVRVGDVVVSVDGEDVRTRRARLARYLPASTPGRLENKIDIQLLLGPKEQPAVIEARGEDGQVRRLAAERAKAGIAPRARPRTGPTFQVLPEGYGYVDLERLQAAEAPKAFDAVRETSGLILDMRGYPSGGGATPLVLRLAQTDTRPVALGGTPRYDGSGSGLRRSFDLDESLDEPLPPATTAPYAGRVVMLVNGGTQSAAEYVGMMLRSVRPVVFLGSTTSGANGAVTRTILPGGIVVNFTGESVRHPDGSPLQRVGIVPDVIVTPTRRGVRDGRDELLDAAVRHLKQGLTWGDSVCVSRVFTSGRPASRSEDVDRPIGGERRRHQAARAAVERHESAAVPQCDREEMGVRDMPVSEQLLRRHELGADEGLVIRPERVTRLRDHALQVCKRLAGRQCVGGEARIRDHAHEAGLSGWTGGPAMPAAVTRKPAVGLLVMHMGGPREGDEDVYVEEAGHCSTARRPARV